MTDTTRLFRLKELLERDLQQIAIKYNTHYQLYTEELAIIPWISEEEKDQCVKDCQEVFTGLQVFYNTQDFDKVVITGDLLGYTNQKYLISKQE